MKIPAFMLLLALTGCDDAPPEQPRNSADPAVAEALFQPLMSDVDMQSAAAPDALPPSDQPATMQIPPDAVVDVSGAPTLGQVAAARMREPAFSKCSPAITYSAQWSINLPDWLELPDGARLAEAAGSDLPGCALRIVRFATLGTPAQSLDRYGAIAKRDGFIARRETTVLTATRASDGAAFRIDTTAIANGTRIDAVSNRGR